MPTKARRRLRTVLAVLLAAALTLCSPDSHAWAHPDSRATVRPAVAASPFVLPIVRPAIVLTAFRPPASRYGPGHRGVDLAIAVGGRVFAAAGGVVVFSGPLAGRGVVSIDHPVGIRTTYEPVAAVVRTGDRVTRGQLIGTVQAGHASCAPSSCLHWGARLPDGSYLDPMGLLAGLRVRLLPWAG